MTILIPYAQLVSDYVGALLPARFLLSSSVFDFIFSLIFVSGPGVTLNWPFRQLLSARKSTVSYRIVKQTLITRCDGRRCI